MDKLKLVKNEEGTGARRIDAKERVQPKHHSRSREEFKGLPFVDIKIIRA